MMITIKNPQTPFAVNWVNRSNFSIQVDKKWSNLASSYRNSNEAEVSVPCKMLLADEELVSISELKISFNGKQQYNQ